MSISARMERTAEALRKNNMDAYCVATKEEVPALVESLLSEGDTVAFGGSVTLNETGVMDLLRGGKYHVLDRYAEGLTRPQVEEIFRQSFFADAYFSSSNAVTERGELYNVDGNSNRVAALCYGPKSVILVVGENKIVADLTEAEKRVKKVAAPLNTKRLNCATYCKETGVCMGVEGDFCTDGCASPARICCTYVTMGYQRVAGRIKVILVGEELGF